MLAVILDVNQSQAGVGGFVDYLFIDQRSRFIPGGFLRKRSGRHGRAATGGAALITAEEPDHRSLPIRHCSKSLPDLNGNNKLINRGELQRI